jgi:hypothetical protein
LGQYVGYLFVIIPIRPAPVPSSTFSARQMTLLRGKLVVNFIQRLLGNEHSLKSATKRPRGDAHGYHHASHYSCSHYSARRRRLVRPRTLVLSNASTSGTARCLGDPKDQVRLPIVAGRTHCRNVGVVGIGEQLACSLVSILAEGIHHVYAASQA